MTFFLIDFREIWTNGFELLKSSQCFFQMTKIALGNCLTIERIDIVRVFDQLRLRYLERFL